MTPAERRALERDVAQTLARLAKLDLEAMAAAFRDFADQLERELGEPVDLGPGIGGISRGDDPRW